jgi:hypothetical protein
MRSNLKTKSENTEITVSLPNLLGDWHAKQHAATAKHMRGAGLARTLLTLAGKEDLSCSVQFPHGSEYTLVVIVRYHMKQQIK